MMDNTITVVDVIILSKTNTQEIFEMNSNAINSLLVSENEQRFKFNIILVESCKTADYVYPKTKVIKPEEPFGYNRYMMIGYKYAVGDFIAFCNNDLIFEKGWFSEMYKIFNQNKSVLSCCPYHQMLAMRSINTNEVSFELGYIFDYHIIGHCIVVKKELMGIINPLLDSTFDFYCADLDYCLTLRKYNIKHAVVFKSKVNHIGGVSTVKVERKNYLFELDKSGIKYPKYFKTRIDTIHNKIALDGHLKFWQKWGGMYSLAAKKYILQIFPFLQFRFFTKILYSIKLPF